MPLFMDRHDVPDATAKDVADAHVSDLEASEEFGVQFISYWFDAEEGNVFCFANAPSRETLEELHSASHGLIPNEIIDVAEDDVFRFLGRVHDPKDVTELTSALRTIMFTDLVGSTEFLDVAGEQRYVELLTFHDGIVREALYRNQGSEVKHTGDGIMASFADASDAVRSATSIIEAFESKHLKDGSSPRVRIGLATGRPVDRNEDIYGETVVLASRLCNAAGASRILLASSVRDTLDQVESLGLSGPNMVQLKGFADPVPAFELAVGSTEHSDQTEDQPPRRSFWRRLFS